MKDISSLGFGVAILFTFGLAGCSSAEVAPSNASSDLAATDATRDGGQIPDAGGGGCGSDDAGGGFGGDGDSGGGFGGDGDGGGGYGGDGDGGFSDSGVGYGGGDAGLDDGGSSGCNVARDCKVFLPTYCTICDGGAESCAHYECVHHRCEILVCE
jgi:hypothetical protein